MMSASSLSSRHPVTSFPPSRPFPAPRSAAVSSSCSGVVTGGGGGSSSSGPCWILLLSTYTHTANSSAYTTLNITIDASTLSAVTTLRLDSPSTVRKPPSIVNDPSPDGFTSG